MQPTGCLRDSAGRLIRGGGMAEDSVPRCAPLLNSNLVPFGRCCGTREAGSTLAESLRALYRVVTHQIRRRRGAARSSTSQGSAELLCARIQGANREVSEGKADVWPRSFFFLRGPTRSGDGKIRGAFSRMHRALDGWMLARALASPAQCLHHHGPRYFNFPHTVYLYDVWP